MKLHSEHGDRDTIVKLIQRARELLQDYRDELPRGRTLPSKRFRERWKHSRRSLREWNASSALRVTDVTQACNSYDLTVAVSIFAVRAAANAWRHSCLNVGARGIVGGAWD